MYLLAFAIEEAAGGQPFPGFYIFFFGALPIPFSTARPRLACTRCCRTSNDPAEIA